MTQLIEECRSLTDEDLERELRFLADREKRGLAKLIAHLSEYDRRRLAQREGHESTFMFCVRVLRYDEGSAYRRVHAARAARRYHKILPMIAEGELSLTAILLLAPILDEENQDAVLTEARGKSKREIERLVAARAPRPPLPDFVRRLPAASPSWSVRPSTGSDLSAASAGEGEAPSVELVDVVASMPPREWQAIVPLSLDRVRIGFDAAVAVMRLVERARQVLRHKYPEGRLEDVLRDALEALLDRKDPQRRLALKPAAVVRDAAARTEDETAQPRFLRVLRAGRYIPAWVKKIVWARDGGRCAWRAEDGRVCGSKDWIEFDHVRPFALGGRSDSPRNVRLLCRTHNAQAAAAAGLSAGAGAGAGASGGAGPAARAGSPA